MIDTIFLNTRGARYDLPELNHSFKFSFGPQADRRALSAPVDTRFCALSGSMIRARTVPYRRILFNVANFTLSPETAYYSHSGRIDLMTYLEIT